MSTLTGTIEQYWTRRASSYTEVVKKNLTDGWDSKWADELIKNFPKKEGLSKCWISAQVRDFTP